MNGRVTPLVDMSKSLEMHDMYSPGRQCLLRLVSYFILFGTVVAHTSLREERISLSVTF